MHGGMDIARTPSTTSGGVLADDMGPAWLSHSPLWRQLPGRASHRRGSRDAALHGFLAAGVETKGREGIQHDSGSKNVSMDYHELDLVPKLLGSTEVEHELVGVRTLIQCN